MRLPAVSFCTASSTVTKYAHANMEGSIEADAAVTDGDLNDEGSVALIFDSGALTAEDACPGT